MAMTAITERTAELIRSLPPGVLLVGAAKTRTPEEARAALEGGLTVLGHNYVQEAEAMQAALASAPEAAPGRVQWHMIGHLQRNKAKRAVAVCDMIETIDSVRLARAVDGHCAALGKTMPVLIEVNSARESSKSGVLPDDVAPLLEAVSELPNIRVQGLMTMGPAWGPPETVRQCFRATRRLLDRLGRLELPNVEMRHLSMGMSSSYRIAIEEGANIVRLGTVLFGAR